MPFGGRSRLEAFLIVAMSADSADRRQLGELLVEKGVLVDAQLQLALAEQETSGMLLGEILVGLGFTKGPTIGNALAEQHGGPLRTEYGLALGPTSILVMPEQTEQSGTHRLASTGTALGRLRVAEPTRDEGTAIARLTAALHERTQELERVQTDLSVLQQHVAELATAMANLDELAREDVER
jgi:hypothetical protein